MKDIIAIRKYTDKNGSEKKEYINVGMLFEKEGKTSVLLKNHINLGAFANEKGEIWLNVYEHKTADNGPKMLYKGSESVKVIQSAVKPVKEPKEEISDEVPF